jgi:cytochrome P450
MFGFAAANRDEAEFSSADQFDVEHKGVNVTSRGPHTCIGQMLARTEMQITFDRLLTRLHNIELAPCADWVTSRASRFVRLRSLRIRFDPGVKLA